MAENNSLNVRKNSLRAWILASRPKTLSAALVPVVVATAMACEAHTLRWQTALLCILFAAVMQIAANLINDLFDFLKGTDGEDRLGPQRACAQGWISPKAMKCGIFVTLLVAAVIGMLMLLYVIEWFGTGLLLTLLCIGAMCIVFSFLYTTMLSYIGLGDLLVWVFFGFVPVCGTYLVQAGELKPEVWWCGAACGMCIDALLVLNNYRDRDTDRMSGKRTLIAVLGEPFGRWYYLFVGLAAVILAVVVTFPKYATAIMLIYTLFHFQTWHKMVEINHGHELNRILGQTSRNILIFGLCLSLAVLM